MCLWMSCTTNSKTDQTTEKVVDQIEKENLELKLVPFEVTEKIEAAELSLTSSEKKDSNYAFAYAVKNYELKSQTQQTQHQHCANSSKGQHIHFIVNNSPYKAKYESEFDETLESGTNVVLAFLSRSYHLSVKNTKAFDLSVIENDDVKSFDFDSDAQHLFYSRPKGVYKTEDAKHILLDFYLLNTQLSENGNKVQVIIDGQEFFITKWMPYLIEGLSAGEHTISIKLIDKDNNFIDGPFNDSGERVISIEQ